jgi:hypothetical protein
MKPYLFHITVLSQLAHYQCSKAYKKKDVIKNKAKVIGKKEKQGI